MKNSRYYDLAHLEEGRDRRGYESKHAKKVLEKVHKLSKDDYLERMRKALVEAQKRNNWQEIKKLEKLLTDYQRRYR